MWRVIAFRFVGGIPLLAAASLVTFLLVHLVPVDPAEAYLQASKIPVTPSAVAAARMELGLDQPWAVQFANWLWRVLHADFGFSYLSRQPVWQEMMTHMPATLELTAAAICWVMMLALPIGIYTALKRGTLADQAGRLFAYIGASLPSYWIGYLLLYAFALRWNLLPVTGSGTFAHLLLPSFTLALGHIAIVSRLLRSTLLEELNKPYVLYARARGLHERTIFWRHVLRHALAPVVTAIGMSAGHLLAGAVLVENVFAWPGLGRYFVTAVFSRDYPVIQCYVLLLTAMFVGANLLVDVVQIMLNPRLHAVKGGSRR
ncbi:nickel ABC transporter permease [Tumebacillus flagellatus]|uniref:Nickel import system permease protein NikB n=1 Tax=Tumebacillus flagellatus TaxID=1157490 RepID=A0A074LP22_9BACL|nr:nickel ABC transporter permease [Tumebacillus flagellatus]KEO82854.1 nickel transporter permease NikB [Tumebacillus flagellatus]